MSSSVINARTHDPLTGRREVVSEVAYITWTHWPINWSAVVIGSFVSVSALIVFGLIAVAIGAQELGAEHRIVDLRKLGIGALICSIVGAFLAFVIGGWAAGRIAGIYRSEPAIVQGAITWCLSVPLVIALAAMGAGATIGGWFGGFTSFSNQKVPYERLEPLPADANAAQKEQHMADQAELNRKTQQWKDETPRAIRNGAIGAVTALLLGLVGSVIGGWLASGEPMNFHHHRTRKMSM